MKQTFTKYLGRITEKMDLSIEEKWIYVHYKKGNLEKTACILKSNNESVHEFFTSFYKENGVSEAMRKEVEKYIMNAKDVSKAEQWKEFTNFLMKTLSLHTVLGVMMAIAVFAGYKLGANFDTQNDTSPAFTLVGIFMGIAIGGVSGYMMFRKYSTPAEPIKKVKIDKPKPVREEANYPVIDVYIEQVRRAVREFSDNLPKGVYRTILVKEDNSIDFQQLAHILKGIPSKKFYMSKETYDLFEEKDKDIPIEMDIVQKAVDQYVKEHKEAPILRFDPLRRVNYYQLLQEHYLKSEPKIQFYITDLDGLVTHIKPEKRHSS
jgi:phage pi2 protein 07